LWNVESPPVHSHPGAACSYTMSSSLPAILTCIIGAATNSQHNYSPTITPASSSSCYAKSWTTTSPGSMLGHQQTTFQSLVNTRYPTPSNSSTCHFVYTQQCHQLNKQYQVDLPVITGITNNKLSSWKYINEYLYHQSRKNQEIQLIGKKCDFIFKKCFCNLVQAIVGIMHGPFKGPKKLGFWRVWVVSFKPSQSIYYVCNCNFNCNHTGTSWK